MRIAGMSVGERLIREQLREGKTVYVRAQESDFQHFAIAGVMHLNPRSPIPDGAALVPATQLLGVELRDEAARRSAEWKLMQTCRRPYDGPADRYLWRAISLRITRALTRTRVTPNQVTLLSTLSGLGTCVLLAAYAAKPWALVAAALCVLSAVILDSVDGELARVRHMGSRLGMWFDNLSDDVIDTSLVACMGVAIGGVWLLPALIGAALRAFAALVIYRGAARLGHPGDVLAFRWWFESTQETEEVYENPLSPMTLLRSLGRTGRLHHDFLSLFCSRRGASRPRIGAC